MEYKGYNIQALGTFPMLVVKAKGSGPVPNKLKGMFTTHREVTGAIDGYLESLKKGPKNAAGKGTSTG